jgi:hypothetical protein
MVSSTYFDLRQIRADLEQFLTSELGYKPLLSEFPSFPVDPDRKTVENCRARVTQHADILILIIGGRYGHVDDNSNKSVTNLEYLAARAKGIPIYAFVDKRTLVALPLWEENPNGNFSAAVDNPRIFEFVKEVRSKDGVWTFEFETAQDIIATLRLQFAHQMLEGLRLRAKLRSTDLPESLSNLGGSAFTLAVEKPDAWEYRLFAQVVSDEVDKCQELKRRFNAKLALGQGERVSVWDIQSWSTPRIQELQRVSGALEYAINTAFQEAVGAPGQPGDVEQIISVAMLVGEAYREALEWSFRIRRAAGEEYLEKVIDAMALFPEDILEKVESLGSPFLKRIEEALAVDATDDARKIDVTVVFELSHLDEFKGALQQLQDDLNSGRIEPE